MGDQEKVPVRTELTVLSADIGSEERKIGFSCLDFTGLSDEERARHEKERIKYMEENRVSPEIYRTAHATPYQDPTAGFCFTCVDVLPGLVGKPWDEYALAWCESLRPSAIRVTSDYVTLDSYLWRVTVMVDDNNIIKRVSQEVRVASTLRAWHGSQMSRYYETGELPKDPPSSEVIGWGIHNKKALDVIEVQR